ncbi:MAG: septum formation initiator family protein [Alphaproteobacteria bacterium]|nr:septum formation initiator family protein [Alphaproteobacteria bacterium]
MSLFAETRRRAQFILGPVLGACLVAYFVFHAIQGERGILAWLKIEQRITAARAAQAETAAERSVLESRVALLRKDNLDTDMLEERARAVLNLVGAREIVIFDDAAPGRPAPSRTAVADVAKTLVSSSN